MPLLEIGALLVAATLLVSARRQRVMVRRHRRRVLRRAFSSADPAERRAAIQVAGEDGLARSAEVFVDLIRRETDPSVLLVLAQIVVRNQWEPADEPNMLRLRLWAHRYLDTTKPGHEPLFSGSQAREYQGPSVGEVVNLLLQRPDTTGKSAAGRRRRVRPWG